MIGTCNSNPVTEIDNYNTFSLFTGRPLGIIRKYTYLDWVLDIWYKLVLAN